MGLIVRVILLRSICVGALYDANFTNPRIEKTECGDQLSYARDGDSEIELRGKAKHEDVRSIDFDGRPLRGIGMWG